MRGFIVGDHAVFVRLMDRPQGDAAHATRTIRNKLKEYRQKGTDGSDS